MSKNAIDLYEEKFVANKIYENLVNYLENIVEEENKWDIPKRFIQKRKRNSKSAE